MNVVLEVVALIVTALKCRCVDASLSNFIRLMFAGIIDKSEQ